MCLALSLGLLASCQSLGSSLPDGTVKVDFSKKQGMPLFKKQNSFKPSGLGPSGFAALQDAREAMRHSGAENLRLDVGMGRGTGSDIGTGSPGSMRYRFGTVDAIYRVLIEGGMMPYLCYSYTPSALEIEPYAHGNPPVDFDKWGDVCYEVAKHYRELGWPLMTECWNEPDLPYWKGTFTQYLTLYDAYARGVRKADPDAKTGGPSFAFIQTEDPKGNVLGFLDYVRDRKLPFDIFTFHSYGTQLYRGDTAMAAGYLGAWKGFSNIEMHITEFSVRAPNPQIQGSWHITDSSVAARVPEMWEAIEYFAEVPSVTTVNWASFALAADKLEFVDYPKTGKFYAPYHVLAIYNNMPIDRVAMDAGSPVQGFASSDETRGCVVLYSKSEKPASVTVDLAGLPFPTAGIRVYAIDAEHSNYVETKKEDKLECVFERTGVSTEGLSYTGELAALGTLYIEVTADGAPPREKGSGPLTGTTSLWRAVWRRWCGSITGFPTGKGRCFRNLILRRLRPTPVWGTRRRG